MGVATKHALLRRQGLSPDLRPSALGSFSSSKVKQDQGKAAGDESLFLASGVKDDVNSGVTAKPVAALYSLPPQMCLACRLVGWPGNEQ